MMKERNRFYRIGTLVLLSGLIVMIFVLSSQPYRKQTIQPFLHRTFSMEKAESMLPHLDIRYDGKEYRREVNPFGFIEFLFRKGAHLFVYGVLATISAFALKLYRKRTSAIVVYALLAVLMIALLDEWNQRYSPARTPTYHDVFVDLAGGLLGLAVFFAMNGIIRRIRMKGVPKHRQ